MINGQKLERSFSEIRNHIASLRLKNHDPQKLDEAAHYAKKLIESDENVNTSLEDILYSIAGKHGLMDSIPPQQPDKKKIIDEAMNNPRISSMAKDRIRQMVDERA